MAKRKSKKRASKPTVTLEPAGRNLSLRERVENKPPKFKVCVDAMPVDPLSEWCSYKAGPKRFYVNDVEVSQHEFQAIYFEEFGFGY